MEFSVSSSELLFHLNKVIGPVGTNKTMPILEDILFELNSSELTIITSDLESTIRTSLTVNSDDNGIFSCPAKMLLETVRSLENQPIVFNVDEDRHIRISSSHGVYNMIGHDVDSWPRQEVGENLDSITLSSDVIIRGIEKTIFATSTDDLRKNMSGVYFQIDFSKLTCVATDAHKLVKYEYKNLTSDVTTSFIIPKKPLLFLKSILEPDEEVVFEFDNQAATFTCGDTVLSCRVLDLKFPDYERALAVNNENTLTVNKKDLLHSLKRLSIYANKTTNQTVFSIAEDSLTLTSEDIELANEATEQIPCKYTGDEIRIHFNARFLMEIVGSFDTDNIIFKLRDSNAATLLVPEENREGENIIMLIMPVIVRN